MDKNVLISLKKLLLDNRKYNTKNLFVCKFKDIVYDEISERGIYEVSYPFFSSVIVFKELDTGCSYKVKRENDEFVEILEMAPFVQVFPEVFYPSLATIHNLNEELKENTGVIKTLR